MLGLPDLPVVVDEQALRIAVANRVQTGAPVGGIDGDARAIGVFDLLRHRVEGGDAVEGEIADGEQKRLRIRPLHSTAAEITYEGNPWRRRSPRTGRQGVVSYWVFQVAREAPEAMSASSPSSIETRSTKHDCALRQ